MRGRKRKIPKEEGEPPTEVLSQEEIDQLLTAINADDEDDDDPGVGISPRGFGGGRRRNFRRDDTKSIKIHDFKRPDVLSKGDFRDSSVACHAVCRSMCSPQTTFDLDNIDQLTHEEFVRSIPTPNFIVVFSMGDGSRKTKAIIQIDRITCKSFLAVMFNSEIKQDALGSEGISVLETKLLAPWAERIASLYSASIGCEYGGILEVADSPEKIFHHINMDEMGIIQTSEVKCGPTIGLMNIFADARFVRDVLRRRRIEVLDPKEGDFDLECDVNVSIRLRPIPMVLTDVLGLKVGKMISTNTRDCQVVVGDTTYFDALLREGGVKTTVEVTGRVDRRKKDMKDMDIVNDMGEMKIPVAVELGRTMMSLRKIQKIGEGSILELDKTSGEPVNVFASNALIARGEVIVIGDTMGVRIVEMGSGLPE